MFTEEKHIILIHLSVSINSRIYVLGSVTRSFCQCLNWLFFNGVFYID